MKECSSLLSVAWYHDMSLIRDYKQVSVWARLAEKCVYLPYKQQQSSSLALFCFISCALKDFHLFVEDLRVLRPSAMIGPWWDRCTSLCSQLCSALFLPPQKSVLTASYLERKVRHICYICTLRTLWFVWRTFRGHRCLPALLQIRISAPWAQSCNGAN